MTRSFVFTSCSHNLYSPTVIHHHIHQSNLPLLPLPYSLNIDACIDLSNCQYFFHPFHLTSLLPSLSFLHSCLRSLTSLYCYLKSSLFLQIFIPLQPTIHRASPNLSFLSSSQEVFFYKTNLKCCLHFL